MKRKEFFELWIKALESGEYKQTKGELERDGKFCCLGVACDIANKNGVRKVNINGEILPMTLAKFMNIGQTGSFKKGFVYNGKQNYSLACLNDNGVRFKTIAKFIREQMENGNLDGFADGS